MSMGNNNRAVFSNVINNSDPSLLLGFGISHQQDLILEGIFCVLKGLGNTLEHRYIVVKAQDNPKFNVNNLLTLKRLCQIT